MPGFITHHLFGVKILSKLPNNYLKNTIQGNLCSFKLGLQGPDIFFYYLPSLIKQGVKNIGSCMHSNNTNFFFENYINVMDSLDIIEKKIAISYLSGFLCHYYLDTTCHPYIYYKSGLLSKYLEPSNEYYASHRTLETNIDTILLKRYQDKKNSTFHKESITYLSSKESDIITYILSTSIQLTYKDKTVTAKMIKSVIRWLKYECILLSDKSGIKKKSFVLLEKNLINYNILSSIIPSDNFIDNCDLLNNTHSSWNSPWNPSIICHTSFIDLFHISLQSCSNALILLNNMIVRGKLIEVNKLSQSSSFNDPEELRKGLLCYIGNKSYHTGLNCNLLFKS